MSNSRIARPRLTHKLSPRGSARKALDCATTVSQFPSAPLTRPIPAANSGLRRPVSAALCASRLTAAKRTLIVEGARFFCSRKNQYRRTTLRLKAKRGSEQNQAMNSSTACAYEPRSSTVPSRATEGLFYPCSAWFSSFHVPYWRPPAPHSVWSFISEGGESNPAFRPNITFESTIRELPR
jgi:hypothetical protein